MRSKSIKNKNSQDVAPSARDKNEDLPIFQVSLRCQITAHDAFKVRAESAERAVEMAEAITKGSEFVYTHAVPPFLLDGVGGTVLDKSEVLDVRLTTEAAPFNVNALGLSAVE